MYSITSVRGHKIVYFKQVEFNITKGITVVQGRNLNRKQKSAANATGKSLLCGMIAEVLMDVPPSLVRNARAARKDIFTAKDSWAEVDLQRGGHTYTIRRTATTLKISKDGVDLNLRTVQLAREFVSKLTSGRTEEEYFAFEYLDSGRPSTFLFGTAASRFQFFTDLFRLNDIDEIRKWLTKQATELKQNDAVVQRLRSELEELGEPTDATGLKKKQTALQSESASLFERQRELATTIQGARVGEMYAKARAELDSALAAAGVSTVKAARKEMAQIERQMADAERRQEAAASLRAARRKVADLKTEIKDLDIDSSMKKRADPGWLVRKADAASSAIDKLADVDAPDVENTISEDEYNKLKPVVKRYRADDVKKQLARFDAMLAQHEEEAEEFDRHFKQHDEDTKCPTCFSKISARTLKLVKNGFDEQIRNDKRSVSSYRKLLADINACADYEAFREQNEAYEHAQSRIKRIRERYPIKQMRKLASLLTELAAAEKVVESKADADTEIDVKALRVRRKQLEPVLHAHRTLAGFPEDAADHADIDLASVVEEERTVSARIAEIGVKLPKLAIRLHAIEQAEARRRELQSELTKLGSDLEDLPVYEALARAYSKSGVKLFLIAKIAKMIETNLNHYSKLLYAEPYEFEFNVAHNKFDALVARKAGGRKLISDVRRLSGMERRTFSVLWLLALLPLIPKSRRSNLLILDEPEANMDPGMVEPFRDVLLPELNKLIPSIIIATPFDSLVTDKTRIVTVVKKGGESSLVEGKVT